MLTAIDDPPVALAAIRAGANGHVVKNTSGSVFLQSIAANLRSARTP